MSIPPGSSTGNQWERSVQAIKTGSNPELDDPTKCQCLPSGEKVSSPSLAMNAMSTLASLCRIRVRELFQPTSLILVTDQSRPPCPQTLISGVFSTEVLEKDSASSLLKVDMGPDSLSAKSSDSVIYSSIEEFALERNPSRPKSRSKQVCSIENRQSIDITGSVELEEEPVPVLKQPSGPYQLRPKSKHLLENASLTSDCSMVGIRSHREKVAVAKLQRALRVEHLQGCSLDFLTDSFDEEIGGSLTSLSFKPYRSLWDQDGGFELRPSTTQRSGWSVARRIRSCSQPASTQLAAFAH